MEIGEPPAWLKPNTEFISVAQGTRYIVTQVGLMVAYQSYDKPDYFQSLIELESFLESWTRGYIVVKGHTPIELWKGYRYSDYDWEKMNNKDGTYLKWSDLPFHDKQMGEKEKYNNARKIINKR